MAWTTPITYVSGAVATAAGMNTYVKDDLIYLKGLLDGTGSGTVTVPARLVVANDSNFYGDLVGGNPVWLFDSGPDEVAYSRSGDYWTWIIGGVEKFRMDSNGKLTGQGFYSSGETSVGAGGAANLTHGLGARPRFVTGFYATSSGAEGAKTIPLIEGNTGNFCITPVTSTQITVNNLSGATIYAHVYAIL